MAGLASAVQERSERGMHNSDSLMGVGGDVRNAFGGSSSVSMGKWGDVGVRRIPSCFRFS